MLLVLAVLATGVEAQLPLQLHPVGGDEEFVRLYVLRCNRINASLFLYDIVFIFMDMEMEPLLTNKAQEVAELITNKQWPSDQLTALTYHVYKESP